MDEPQPDPHPQRLCASADLAERGKAVLFDVLEYARPQRAFALRIDGGVVAYINRCVHVPVEMDWIAGEFLDADRRAILCSVHGAVYDPKGGHCLGGPCGRGRLTAVSVAEQDGHVHWYPSRDIRPAPQTAAHPASGADSPTSSGSSTP